MKQKQTKRHPRGVVALEAALVLPVLILIILAGLQYGWLFLKKQEITNVARHAVRYASRPNVSFAAAEDYIDAQMTQLGLDSYIIWGDGATKLAGSPTSPDYEPDGPVGDALYAQVSINAEEVDIINWLPVPARLTAHAAMSKEGDSP